MDKPRVRVLGDEVADKDELGTHERIASEIADLIESSDAGKAIALIGSWGSGKSSVVKMLGLKLTGESQLFLYDAWAHQGDPPHRSLLEQLGDFLAGIKWMSKIRWLEDRERLAKRRETTEVTHHRKPTLLGYLISLFALLVPLGLLVLSQQSGGRLAWVPDWAGFVLTLLPFVLALACVGFSYMTSDENRKTHLRYVMATKSTEILNSDTYKTLDPTTIEFQELYKRLLKESLKRNQRRLVIV